MMSKNIYSTGIVVGMDGFLSEDTKHHTHVGQFVYLPFRFITKITFTSHFFKLRESRYRAHIMEHAKMLCSK